MLRELVNWERSSVAPVTEKISGLNSQDMQSACLVNMPVDIGNTQASVSISSAVAVLTALRKSVMRRTILNHICKAVPRDYEEKSNAPVAVLFSGGLDSMILAAILDECLDTKYEIDLLNVSFDEEFAPDRISSRTGLKELCRVAPLRSWKLVEIDANLSSLTSETKHVMSLINPANTYMVQPKGKGNVAPKKIEGGLQKHLILPFTKGNELAKLEMLILIHHLVTKFSLLKFSRLRKEKMRLCQSKNSAEIFLL